MDANPLGAESASPYLHLTGRAVEFIRSRGGSVTEEALIAFVFGAAGSAAIWQPLLRQIMETEERLALRPDGCWGLASPPAVTQSSALTDFVAIDVETTGLKPLRQRVIEIALIRFHGDEIVDRFSTLINPGRRIPKFISTLTGIDDGLVEEAPAFADIAGSIESFVSGALLVGHNVVFDINFLNAELSRAGHAALANERLDVMGMASRLLPGLRRPSLEKAARHLGFDPRKLHRAEADAELAGRVALCLAAQAQEIGIDSLDRLRSVGRPAVLPAGDGVTRGASMIDRSILASMPKRPGVYLMRDRHDRIIYVGKAKNLRDRVASYFSQPLGYTRKMDGLLESTGRIDYEETGSELAALLLESQLIRRYQPRYNVVMRAAEHYPYIRIDVSGVWPRVSVSTARTEDGAAYFGPFKNQRAVRTAIELINNHYPLRTCTRSFKSPRSYGSPCIRLDLGRCLGPCVGRASRDEYMLLVREVVAFLDGRNEVMLDRLHTQLDESAEQLDFERARKLRNSIRLLQSLIGAHVRLKQAAEAYTLIIVQPGVAAGTRNVLLVISGRIWSSTVVGANATKDDLAQRLSISWRRYMSCGIPPVDNQAVDDVAILARWVARASGSPCLTWLDAAEPDWQDVASRVHSLTDEEIANPFEHALPATEDELEELASDGAAIGLPLSAGPMAGGEANAAGD